MKTWEDRYYEFLKERSRRYISVHGKMSAVMLNGKDLNDDIEVSFSVFGEIAKNNRMSINYDSGEVDGNMDYEVKEEYVDLEDEVLTAVEEEINDITKIEVDNDIEKVLDILGKNNVLHVGITTITNSGIYKYAVIYHGGVWKLYSSNFDGILNSKKWSGRTISEVCKNVFIGFAGKKIFRFFNNTTDAIKWCKE